MNDSKSWTPLFQAFSEALDWALDRAADLARNYPAEVATLERVRSFMHRRIVGDPAHVRPDDLLFALGLIGGMLERDVLPSHREVTVNERAPVAAAVRRAPARTLRAKLRPARQVPMRVNHRGRAAAVDGKSPIQHSLFAH